MDYLYFIRPFLSKLGEIEGISKEEISVLERKYKVNLPDAYKQYMMVFGKKNGNFMQGVGMRIDELNDIPEAYQYDFAHTSCDNPVPFGDNWYFFGMDQGNFLFFECDGNPDPKVWIMWSLDTVDDIYPSFSAFLLEEVDGKSKYWE